MEFWPVQIVGIKPFNIHDLRDGGILESRELVARNKNFFVSSLQPEPMLGDVRDFKARNVFAASAGFHLTAPYERAHFFRE